MKTMRLLFAIWYASEKVLEDVIYSYSVTYFQYSSIQLSAQQSTLILTVSQAVYTFELAMNAIYQYKFRIDMVMAVHYLLQVIGLILLILAKESIVMVWLCNMFLYLGISAMRAGTWAFTEENMILTNQISTFFMFLKSIGLLITPYIIGKFISNNSEIFYYVIIFCMSFAILSYIAILIFIKIYSNICKSKCTKL